MFILEYFIHIIRACALFLWHVYVGVLAIPAILFILFCFIEIRHPDPNSLYIAFPGVVLFFSIMIVRRIWRVLR